MESNLNDWDDPPKIMVQLKEFLKEKGHVCPKFIKDNDFSLDLCQKDYCLKISCEYYGFIPILDKYGYYGF